MSVENDGECGGGAGFCGEEVARAIGGAGFGNGDAVGVVVGIFDSCCCCFSPRIVPRVIGGCGEGGGDIAVVDVIIDAGDGDCLGCIPVRCCEGER